MTWAFLRPQGRTVLDAEVFPAADRRAVQQNRSVRASTAVSDSQATCFHHVTLQAEAVCDDCGSYLCAMCALPVGGRTLCPTCVVGSRSSEAGSVSLVESRPLWGPRARLIAVLGLLFPPLWFVLPLVSMAVLMMVWKGWDKPGSLVQPGRGALITAAILALPGFAGGVTLWALLLGVWD